MHRKGWALYYALHISMMHEGHYFPNTPVNQCKSYNGDMIYIVLEQVAYQDSKFNSIVWLSKLFRSGCVTLHY